MLHCESSGIGTDHIDEHVYVYIFRFLESQRATNAVESLPESSPESLVLVDVVLGGVMYLHTDTNTDTDTVIHIDASRHNIDTGTDHV